MSMMVNPSRFAVVGGGGGGSGPHRYWRVRGIYNNSSPMACSELELRTAIGGATVCTGGTAISRADYGSGYSKDRAFDGNLTDGHEWAAPGADPGVEWIGYDFGAGNEKSIVEVSYKARQLFGSQSPNKAVLEYSDDAATWLVEFPIVFGTFANDETKVRHATAAPDAGAEPHTYWRINFLSNAGGYNAGREGELRLTSGGADITDTEVILYSDNGHFSNWSFDRMFDGDLNALTAINAGPPSYGQAQFFNPVTIEEFVWRARNGGGANYQVPLSGSVSYSDDGITWTAYWGWDTAGWADDETKTFSNPGADVSAYIRDISIGDRTSIITLTVTNIAAGASVPTKLIDGSQGDVYWWTNATGNGTGWIDFDFAHAYLVDQIRWTQSGSNTHGVWRLEGSNDGSSYVQVGADITLGPGTFDFANSTAYRYYRLRHMSGNRSQSPYLREIEFRAGPRQ